MRILQLSTDFLPNIGGVASHIYNLSKQLVRMGNEVYVLNPRYDLQGEKEEEKEGILIRRIYVRSNIPKFRYLKMVYETLSYIKKLGIKFDIIHQHDMYYSSMISALLWNTSWIWTNHTSEFIKVWKERPNFLYYFTKFVNQRSRVIICTSPELKNISKSMWTTKRIVYIPNGVDFETFSHVDLEDKLSFMRKLNLKEEDFIVTIPRRWERKNGIEYMVKAIPLILKNIGRRFPIKFLFVGSKYGDDENYKQKIIEFIKAKNLMDFVVILESLPYESMPAVYHVSDIVVIPSLIEAVSLAALEALAAGKPVVATSVGGLPEIIKNKDTGILVAPKNPEEIAEAIIRLIYNKTLRDKVGRNGQKFVLRHFSWESIAERIFAIYREIVYRG